MRLAAVAPVALLASSVAFAACSDKPPASPPAAFPSPQTPPPRVGTPLPQGWVWPFDLANVARAFDPYAIYRPIDITRLLSAQGSGPCAPVEVAPNVWIQPLCVKLPRMPDSTAVPTRKAFQGAALPAWVDLRQSNHDGPVKNQGMVGICWSFAISTLMDNAVRRVGRADVLAPLHVMSSGTWDELWRSGRTEHATVREQEWPYDPAKACRYNEDQGEVWCEEAYHVRRGSWRGDPQLVAELQRADASGYWRISSMEKLSVSPADPNQMASVLAAGQSLYVGMNINTQAFKHRNISNGVIPDWYQADAGHAMVVVGYRPVGATRQFLLHNSWGTDWGDRGYAWVSEAMLARHTDQAFVVEVAQGGSPSVPVPVPTAPPTGTTAWPAGIPTSIPGLPVPGSTGGSDCAAGQARDMVLGTCVPACSGGYPPVAGVCMSGSAPSNPSGCPAGQVRDWLTGGCSAQCANGLPPAGGLCL